MKLMPGIEINDAYRDNSCKQCDKELERNRDIKIKRIIITPDYNAFGVITRHHFRFEESK